VAFDALISRTARSFVGGLAPSGREEFEAVLDSLLDNPLPDGIRKVELGFPYRPGIYGFAAGSFWIAYLFLNPHVLYIPAVYWSPDSPNHPLHHRR
jgi:hypothetical protein